MLFDVGDVIDLGGRGANAGPDLFADKKRAAWKSANSAVARCDFAPDRWRLNSRGILFISLWKASVYGMALTDIKADPDMPNFFAENISDFIRRFFNISVSSDSSAFSSWCIITPPPRRHLQDNFAVRVASLLSHKLGIEFIPEVARANSRQRVNAVFDLLKIPQADNIICFDDIVTTGSTFQAMHRILSPLGKNILFVAGINNKL